jgi:hypothetical protein
MLLQSFDDFLMAVLENDDEPVVITNFVSRLMLF